MQDHRNRHRIIAASALAIVAAVSSSFAHATEFAKTPSKSIVTSVTVHEGTNLAATISPDHKTIIFDLQSTLWSIPVGGGTAKRLTDPLLEPARPDWSPKGDLVAFQAYKGGTFHIWVIKPDGGGLRQLTSGHGDDREPRISPDGTQVAFASDRGFKGNYDIWTVDIATGKLTQRTSDSDEEFEPTWSPDGKTIAFASGVGVTRFHGASVSALDIKAVDEQGNIRTVFSLPREEGGATDSPLGGVHLDSPAYSPDGRLAYTVLRGNTSELYLDGKRVGSTEDVFPFYPAFLPGGKVLYTGDGKILVTDLASNETKSVAFAATFAINRPGYRHRIYDFDSVKPTQVKGILHPALSPDGSQVVFAALNQLWLLKIGQKPEALTSDSFYKQDPSFSPDGTKVMYASDQGGWEAIYVLDLATRQSRRLTHASGHAELAPAWAQDGREVAFHDEEGATYIADVASGDVRELFHEVFGPSEPSWLPNGKSIAISALTAYNMRFREGTSRIVTIDVATGKPTTSEPAPFETITSRGYNGPRYSPDGRQLVFVLDGYLYARPVDDAGVPNGPAKQITHETADSPSWSGDSKHILYLSNGKLRLIAADGGGTPSDVPVDLTWTRSLPKGRTIIHAGQLWDGLGPDVKTNVDLTIQGNRILSITPHTQDPANLPVGDRFIDASQQTIIPGLWESHNHEYGGIQQAGDAGGRLWLAYGFTELQSQGDEGYLQEEVRESFAANKRVGPRYFATGELLDGERIFYPTDRSVRSEAQIQREFDREQSLDADNYKTYVRFPHAWQEELAKLAHEKAGVWIASHYGLPGLQYGVDGMTHVSATSRWGYAYTRSSTGITYEDIRTLFPATGEWDISTAFAGTALYANDPVIADDARLKALNAPWSQKALIAARDRTVKTNPTGESEVLRREDETVAALYHKGDKVLLGIDSAAPGAQIPIHLSLRAEVRYGLKPWEALQTATILPARAFGYGKDLGSIEPGKLADLDILDGNPLENINDAVRVKGVLVNGRYYTQEELKAPFQH